MTAKCSSEPRRTERNKLVGLSGRRSDGQVGRCRRCVVDGSRPCADSEEAGDEDVVRKVVADLAGKASADEVRAKLKEMLPVAKAQLLSEI